MFMHNTEQWDYPTVAALVAPRPLLIVNTDSDPIFPLDGVVRVFEEARHVYKLLGAADKIALAIGPGSFTGLRIGLATALGLSFGTERRIIPVPTLAALAPDRRCPSSRACGWRASRCPPVCSAAARSR